MNKIIILLILVLGIGINGCEESVKIEDLSKAYLDQDFKSFMTNNANLKSRFLKTNQTEKSIEVFRSTVETSDLQKISEKLGFNSLQELDKFGSNQKAAFDRFLAKYPTLNGENGLNVQQFKSIVDAYIKNENDSGVEQKFNGRTKGCVGGYCLQSMINCTNAADADFSLGSAMCFTYVYYLPAYVLCQAGVTLNWSVDNSNCIRFYDDCCAP